jgi:transcriptional regulator with XRE-family HTH domain
VKKKTKIRVHQEWAGQITALRERLHINHAELARKLQCSAMTISRWERGLLQPSAEHFIQLGNLGDKNEAWAFWERAGIQPAKMVEALNAIARSGRRLETPRLERARAGAASVAHHETADLVGLPLLNAVVGTHGVRGDRRSSLQTIASSKIIGAPAPWCPNPAYTSLIRVKGHSMEALDSRQRHSSGGRFPDRAK